jgi:cytochrome c oxidase subunit 2
MPGALFFKCLTGTYVKRMHSPHGRCIRILAMCCLLSACGRQTAEQDAGIQWDESVWQPAQIQQLEHGRALYQQKCAACHLASGQGQTTLGAPALKGSAVVTGPAAGHIDVVLNGRSNGTMPAFGNSLETQSIADIVSYERNAWGNNDPVLIGADQVEALKSH